ncbi:DUF922 domain-containing Zn-dependent protease [Allorhizobium undicola]|uniref:DUF922 domain-containing Zn-dependent protease n=1 Tax=Allorhizobium undicola TaxID=78527 RepID=UPI00048727A9|nr:DUF922 domain-containing protein [Allorhizobium undicola]
MLPMRVLFRWSGLAMALAALCTGQANAETVIRKSYSYFAIQGRTADDLDHELDRRGPQISTTGSRHPGLTRIRFGGTIDYLHGSNRCAVGGVKVTLNIKVILPRWKNRAHAERGLGLVWDTLAADIKRHEERHAEIAKQYARQLETALKTLRPEKTCEALQEKVAETTDKITDAHTADQIRFDRVEALNFNNRIMRLLKYRATQTR